jgi:hypothetical protein
MFQAKKDSVIYACTAPGRESKRLKEWLLEECPDMKIVYEGPMALGDHMEELRRLAQATGYTEGRCRTDCLNFKQAGILRPKTV